jgi:hypothetical protein
MFSMVNARRTRFRGCDTRAVTARRFRFRACVSEDLIARITDTQPERVTDPGERSAGVVRRVEPISGFADTPNALKLPMVPGRRDLARLRAKQPPTTLIWFAPGRGNISHAVGT